MPPPGAKSESEYAALSHRFVDHARQELAKGNRLQASEKVWGAANQALKAIAVRRGWRHDGQRNVFAISNQLAVEKGRPTLARDLLTARGIHYNFYDNDLEEGEIEEGINAVEEYVADLDAVRAAPSQPFTISSERDQNRIRRLTGTTYAIGTHSENGFTQAPPPTDESPDGGGDTDPNPAVPPGPGGQPPGGGGGLRVPEGRSGLVDVQLKPGKSLPQDEPENPRTGVGRRRRRGTGQGERGSNRPPKIRIKM